MPAEPDGGSDRKRPFRPRRPLVIGLVGGIAAGKSAVAGLFETHGLRHVDADRHARAVAAEPAVLAEISARLGPKFVVDGRLDRPALAREVFTDPEQKRQLEEILHPRVRARIRDELDQATAAGQSCLLDVPLLYEAGLFERCDTVVFVAAGDDVRAARAADRGWAPDELARRERNQLPLADKRVRADHVIDNDDDLATTAIAVATLLTSLEQTA